MDMNEVVDIVHDAEATGLLNDETIDYTASPWKPRDSFKMHVIAVQEFPSGNLLAFYDGPTYILDGRPYHEQVEDQIYTLVDYEPVVYKHYPLRKYKDYITKRKIRKAVAHNGIGFDLPAYKVVLDMEFTIGSTVEKDSWCGKHIEHVDTLVMSKCQNPDRFGGHGLSHMSKLAGGVEKTEFRYHMPKDRRFLHFAADMLHYNLFDVKSNWDVYKYLLTEQDGHDWSEPIQLEKKVADIIVQQSHRGFHYNMARAEKCIAELDAMMEERRVKVEPLLPPKKATKGYMKDFTPPKKQFNKDGSASAILEKFIDKIGGTRVVDPASGWLVAVEFDGKQWAVPFEEGVPLRTQAVATINDTTHIKEWLVSLGWMPNEYKEKDLTLKSGKKIKLTDEEYEVAVERYVEQTLESSFCEDRCDFLATSPNGLRAKLLARGKGGRGMKVRTNPSFTTGQDKEMCRNLEKMTDKFPFAKDVIEYLTYKHRRNSILGGGADWDEDEEPEKGYLAAVRKDGRIPTPADSCGASTSRMKHRVVANVPRVTSLYGEPMREQFEADPEMCYQIGYDFASLEARMEGHYCFDYEKPVASGVREYCESLLQEKPHDVHTKTAQQISFLLGRDFARGDAKAVKYGCTYGAQAAKVAKTIGADLATGQAVFDAFWQAALPLKKLKEALQKHWEKNGKKYILTIDGRKVPTRAAHSILNSLFQSAGVICAKRTMVVWVEKMEAAGLSVDFWRDDWKNKSWATQMVAYHDEAQIEVTKDLVKFKRFTREALGWKDMGDKDAQKKEDARCVAIVNAWRQEQLEKTGQVWSETHEAPKGGWFVAYSLPGQLVVEAVAEVTEYYKLKVPLSADYVVGTNWSNCH